MTIRIFLSVSAAAFLSYAQPTTATPLYDMTPMLNQWQSSMGNDFQAAPPTQPPDPPRFAPPPPQPLQPAAPVVSTPPPPVPTIQAPTIQAPTVQAPAPVIPKKMEEPAFQAPVQAAEAPSRRKNKQGAYVAFGAGLSILQDASLTTSLVSGLTGELTFDPGFAVRGAVGGPVGNNIRSEFEVSFRRHTFDQATLSFAGASISGSVDGSIDTTSFLANTYYDVPTSGKLSPYLGLGVGGAYLSSEGSDDLEFAYQATAGMRYAITPKLSLTGDYRFFATLDPTFSTVDAEFHSHNFTLGVMQGF